MQFEKKIDLTASFLFLRKHYILKSILKLKVKLNRGGSKIFSRGQIFKKTFENFVDLFLGIDQIDFPSSPKARSPLKISINIGAENAFRKFFYDL